MLDEITLQMLNYCSHPLSWQEWTQIERDWDSDKQDLMSIVALH